MNNILKNEISASNKNFKVYLSFISEGYYGDYDETNPDDEPLLRIDIHAKDEYDRRKWDCENSYSSCTGISARITAKEAKEMCNKVLNKLNAMPEKAYRNLEYYLMRAWETALEY